MASSPSTDPSEAWFSRPRIRCSAISPWQLYCFCAAFLMPRKSERPRSMQGVTGRGRAWRRSRSIFPIEQRKYHLRVLPRCILIAVACEREPKLGIRSALIRRQRPGRRNRASRPPLAGYFVRVSQVGPGKWHKTKLGTGTVATVNTLLRRAQDGRRHEAGRPRGDDPSHQ